MKEISFIVYNREVLEKSWEWLNDPEVKYLTMTPDFTKEEQLSWFNQLNNNSHYFVKGVLFQKQIIGVVGLKKINLDEKTAEYFGYIGEKKYWGKGIGKEMMNFIKEYAKEKLGLNSLYLKVILDNTRAIKAYEKMGFREFRRDNNIIEMINEI
ncbi:GNAT family N-acetyltransferase [Bergeyella sp. RCAD1439]|uniref:GNAT family N-acetyltransferase n=1 Tax=Bergeyella anatis TaxID=3113737 RepID=UPI002E18EEC7|nr:GNAT family N-acetyltransferase [Bergeyella sp. RCAD1439]